MSVHKNTPISHDGNKYYVKQLQMATFPIYRVWRELPDKSIEQFPDMPAITIYESLEKHTVGTNHCARRYKVDSLE